MSLVVASQTGRFTSLTVQRAGRCSGDYAAAAGRTSGGRIRSRGGCAVRFHIVHVNAICGCITLGMEHVRGHSQIPKDRQEDGNT